MKKSSLLTFIMILTFFSCNRTSKIEGLWIVKSVVVGDEEMTPNARWTRFNSDSTQESGNGRFQHSYGAWKFNEKTDELLIENTNGLDDTGEPFLVSLNKNQMIWERTEEGQNIKVTLERSTQLPETFGDKILGLWELEEAIGNGSYFQEPDDKETGAYIFFRWDRRFVIKSKKGKIHGVYNVHGHKPEVELIPYGEQLQRDFWEITYHENHISLKLLNSDTLVTRKFRRIRKFPD